MAKEKKFLKLAEKIVWGLIEHTRLIDDVEAGKPSLKDNSIIKFHYPITTRELAEAIAKAMREVLTYENMSTLTLRNNEGKIVAKLYIYPDGTLADDSWLCNKGWK